MRLLAVVALLILAMALADARRVQRRGPSGLKARRMMKNRGMGGNKPMSMRRTPYGSVARRDNGPSIDMDMTSTSTERRDGPSIDMEMTNTGRDKVARRASTSTEDPLYVAFYNAYESLRDLSDSVSFLEHLPWMCTDHSAEAKRDATEYEEYDELLEEYIEGVENKAEKNADKFVKAANKFVKATDKLTKSLDTISALNIILNCDMNVFCTNLGYIQDYYQEYVDYYDDDDLQEVYDEVCK